MNLRLIKLDEQYKKQLIDMMEEWNETGEKIIPWAIRKADYHDFKNYLKSFEILEDSKNIIPSTTLFCLDIDRNILVGAINIRHKLDEQLLLNGGHIGDGVRPSERGKGIATEMIKLALQECRKMGIHRVLMVCDKENIASAKSIIKNGGVLENEVLVDNIAEQRYWIEV